MGITDTGYQRRTRDVVLTEIQDYLRDKISAKLDLSERTVLGNVSNLMADHIDQLEQLVEEAYNAFDPDNASDDRFVALSLLTGVPRRGATKGLVKVTLEIDDVGSLSFAPGDLAAHVIDEPGNRWLNRDALVCTPGPNEAVFESENAGAAAIAEAGTLTVIATPITGWLSVTNAAAATPGQDIESIAALRIRREAALSIGGSRTRGAIRSKLALLDGVLSVEVFANSTNTTDANGIPAHAIRAVVWDGVTPAANDDAIAQVIYDHIAEGIISHGGQLGTARDETLGPVSVAFDRATVVEILVDVVIESATGVNADDVAQAIIDAMPNTVGAEVKFHRLAAAIFTVQGVDDYTDFHVQSGSADLPAVQNTIYTLARVGVSVTGDVT